MMAPTTSTKDTTKRQVRLRWFRRSFLISNVLFLLTILLLLWDHFAFVSFAEAALAFESRQTSSSISFEALQNKRILVVGGSGRVGGSVVTQLVQRGAGTVVVGGTNVESFEKSRRRWMQLFPDKQEQFLNNVEFVKLDREQASSVQSVLQMPLSSSSSSSKFDLVVHTAGPFQGKVKVPNGVLEACVERSVPYIDVCDDYCTASAAKTKYAATAVDNNVPCILSTGCWPGVSSLMAKQLTRSVLQQNTQLKPDDLKVDFGFFTSGSGGAGATLLVATFLILAEKALVIQNGRRREVQPMKEYSVMNFGPIIGDRYIAPLNLLETASVHDVLGIGSVSSQFGTAPDFWNALLGAMAQLPPELLANEDIMRKLSVFSMPIVRLVDAFAGATNAMRCDVTYSPPIKATADAAADSVNGEQFNTKNNIRATAIYGHKNLEPCVGECVAAFCCAILTPGKVPPGVWLPEQAIEGGPDAASVLSLAGVGCHTLDVETRGGVALKRRDVWGEASGDATKKHYQAQLSRV